MSQDFKADQVKTSKLIFSSSVLLIHSNSVSSDVYGSIDTSKFLLSGLGTDTSIYLSGSSGSKDTSTRGVVVIGGDLVVSGVAYDALGNQIGAGSGGGIGSAGESFYNHISLGIDSNSNTDAYTIIGAVSYNKADFALNASTHKTFFSTISYITAENITGSVQLYDLTNASSLCIFTVTSSTPINHRVEVSPATGTNIIEVRIKVDSGSLLSDKIICLGSRVESVNTVS